MWTHLVVLDEPAGCDLPHLVQVAEQIQVQDLVAASPVEALDAGTLARFARLDVPNEHAMLVHPLHERLSQELRPLVTHQVLVLIGDVRQKEFQPLGGGRLLQGEGVLGCLTPALATFSR